MPWLIKAVDSEINKAFNQHIMAQKVPLLARDNISQAKSWIATCLAEHSHCREFQKKTVGQHQQRPTRVLEVTPKTATLRCDMADKDFDYLVLSHMWVENNDQQLRLLKDNLAEFQVAVPWDRLNASPTFSEAVRITCALGYRYLWIDSLCIIQDSKPDWDHEARRMAFVYGNATCNLACLFPPQDGHLPKVRGDPRTYSPCILRPATPTRPGVYIESDMDASMWVDERYGLDWVVEKLWPLFKRAWTFQEYLLSPRTLLLGHKNLMFQCSEVFYDELLGSLGDGHGLWIDDQRKSLQADRGKSKYFSANMKAVAKASSLSAPVTLSFLREWWALVGEYRARKLSNAKDRIMAFAGIAQSFQNLGSLTYLAGAWRECLPLCLLWYIDEKPYGKALQANDLPYGSVFSYDIKIQESVSNVAPSWSWFSVPIYAFHQPHFHLNDDEELARRRSNRESPVTCFDDIYWASTVSYQFKSHAPNHFPESGFFDFEGLRVTLSMPTVPMTFNWPTSLFAQFRAIKASTTCTDDMDFDCEPVYNYYPDNISTKSSKGSRKNRIRALITEFQIVRTGGKFFIQRRFAGLVLTPADTEGTWRRVGAWRLNIKVEGVPVDRENIAAVAKRWKEYPFISSEWEIKQLTLV